MKFGQLINYSVRINFSKIMHNMRKENQFQITFFLKKKALYKVKESGKNLYFSTFCTPRLGHTIKTRFIAFQTVDPGISSILIIYKRVWNQLPHHILGMISRKTFLQLYSIKSPNFIVWLGLFLEILGNMCIMFTCCPVCDGINFEINNSFLIKLFFQHSQKVRTKLQIPEEQKKL